MTTATQHRLCRAGLMIGALLCLAALINGVIVTLDVLRQFKEIEPGALDDPLVAGRVAGEVAIVAIIHLWPLPVGVLLLVISLIWRRRLRKRLAALA